MNPESPTEESERSALGSEVAPPDAPRRERPPESLVDTFMSGYALVPGTPPFAFYGLAVVFLLLGTVQFPAAGAPLLQFVQTIVPWSAAAFLLGCGYWVTLGDRAADRQAAGVLMATILMAVATGTVGLVLVSEAGELRTTFDWLFAFTAAMSAGAMVGAPTGFVIDSLAAYQSSLESSYRQSKQLNQRLRVLNRVLRHNVRNELTVALGGLALVEAELPDTQSRTWYERSTAALHRLHTHTEKLIRLDSEGLFGSATATVDIAAYTRAYLADAAAGPTTEQVTVAAPETARVAAHPLVGSAIAEALHNALLHGDDPDIRVAIDIRSDADRVTVSVADTGPGIPKAELRALDHGGEDPLGHSQGVGLWFIKWVVEASNGALSFDANEPTGTVVRMRLPHASA